MDIKLIDFIMGSLCGTVLSSAVFIYWRNHDKNIHALKSKELNHRIQNNLSILTSMIKIQRRKSADVNNLHTLINVENKIYSIALLYRYLNTQQDLCISSSRYFKELIEHITHCYSLDNQRIDINISCENIHIESQKISILGIIINELLTNTVKHTFSRKISISFKPTSQGYQLLYNDNSEKFKQKVSYSGKGKEMLKMFAQTINASIQFSKKGSMCQIDF